MHRATPAADETASESAAGLAIAAGYLDGFARALAMHGTEATCRGALYFFHNPGLFFAELKRRSEAVAVPATATGGAGADCPGALPAGSAMAAVTPPVPPAPAPVNRSELVRSSVPCPARANRCCDLDCALRPTVAGAPVCQWDGKRHPVRGVSP